MIQGRVYRSSLTWLVSITLFDRTRVLKKGLNTCNIIQMTKISGLCAESRLQAGVSHQKTSSMLFCRHWAVRNSLVHGSFKK